MRRSKNIFESFYFALRGLIEALKSERNFRIQFLAAVLVVILGLALKIGVLEWIVLLILIAIVLSLELINSSFEKMLNVIHPDEHPDVKLAKDFLAAGVLIASLIAVIVGVIIFLIAYLYK